MDRGLPLSYADGERTISSTRSVDDAHMFRSLQSSFQAHSRDERCTTKDANGARSQSPLHKAAEVGLARQQWTCPP